MSNASFASQSVTTTVLSTSYSPRWIGQTYVVDLNVDGNSDLLVLGASYPSDGAPVSQPSLVAFGNGKGGFGLATQTQFPFASLTTIHPREAVFADFNSDGFPDVFVADHGYDANPFPGAQNQLFLSNGDGTWRNANANLPALSDFTHSAATADINGDGAVDILVGNTPRPNVIDPYVLINNGAGVFTRDTSVLPTSAGAALNADVRRFLSIALADLDNDGRTDLVAGTGFSTDTRPVTTQVLWNQSGSYAQSTPTDLPFPATFGRQQSVYDIQATDLNSDGRLDLLLAYQRDVALGGWELQVLINEGNRTFSDQTVTYLPDAAARTGGMPSAASAESQYWVSFINPVDVNNDGRQDFYLDARGITSAPAGLPLVYVRQAEGNFAATTVGELGGTNNRWIFDYTTQYVAWEGGSGFVHVRADNGTASLDVLPVQFSPELPVLSDQITKPLVLVGTAGADSLTGGIANDRFTGGAGDDVIDGGSGRDTAFFNSAYSNYTVTKTATGYSVKDNSGSEGTDTVVRVERLKFSDKTIAIDISGNAGQAYRLYQAAFDRTPDKSGLSFQTNALDSGWGLVSIAQNFIDSPEFANTYGALNNSQFVTQLYANVLNRAPDASGLAYHVGNLDGGMARAAVLVGFSESPENQAAVIGVIQNGIELA